MKIVQVKELLKHRTIQLQAPNNADLKSQQKILLKERNDLIVAKVLTAPREVPNAKVFEDYSFERVLTDEEFLTWEKSQEHTFERVVQARDLAEKHELPMHFFATRSSFDGKIWSFFFQSEKNIDFRALVKDMAQVFKKRIHLQRVNAQDRAVIVGGVGICGRTDCCSFLPVPGKKASMDSVRDQGIMIKNNPRIYGLDGKIKGCFAYEQDTYRKERQFFPHMKQKVTVNDREGRVKGLDILNGNVKVDFGDGIIDTFPIQDIQYANKRQRPEGKTAERSDLMMDLHGETV